ncbi:MAG TPA: prolyl oligopeptidase family serine peptidase [Candidatus Eremiobacteraceae bacterium]|nr:prolyl oligopeptidase family serine peptidase [Candidatus Eremiobacteraceae bacterium]
MRQLFCLIVLASLIVAFSGSRSVASPARISYPPTPRDNVVDTYYGVKVADPYRWLESLDSSQTKEWIAREDALTRTYLDSIPMKSQLERSAGTFIGYGSMSPPEHHGPYWFRWMRSAGSSDDVFYVSESPGERGTKLLDPSIVLRPNEQLGNYVRYVFSPNGRYLAYSTIKSGSDWETWHVRDVTVRRDLSDKLVDCAFASPAWTKDSSAFYYVHYPVGSDAVRTAPKLLNPGLYLHRVGTAQADDSEVFSVDTHPDWFIGATSSEDGRYLIIGAGLGETTRGELMAADLRNSFKLSAINLASVSARFIGNDGPRLYFLTSEDAPRRRVVAVDLNHSGRISTVVAQQADTAQMDTLLGNEGSEVGIGTPVSLVGNKLYIAYLHDAHTIIKIFSTGGHQVGAIALPGIGTADAPTSAYRWDRYAYYTYTSNATPDETFRFDTETDRSTLFWRPTVSVDTSGTLTELVFATSKDGTRVPMFVTRQRDRPLNGSSPTILWGYGGSDWDNTPRYSPQILEWVALGGTYAVAVVRGGTEYGDAWHNAATGPTKQRSFDDYIACAKALINGRYTSPKRLAAYGASDGGLLVGAAVTQRPDLFGAAIAESGSYDMVRGDRMPGDGWVDANYGSADASETQFRTLFAYSPYHHVQVGTRYPAMLIITGDSDDRVSPAHSLKFAAALQHAQAGNEPILLYVEPNTGHYASAPAGGSLAFLTKVLNFAPHFSTTSLPNKGPD